MAQNEINGRFRVVERDWKVSFPFPDDDGDVSAKLLISRLDDASLTVERWVEAAAIVKDQDTSCRQRSQVINRSRLRRETVQRGIARVISFGFFRLCG
jgi:hypothetical protein